MAMKYTIEFENRWWYYGTLVMAGVGVLNTVMSLLLIPTLPWILHIAAK